MLSKEESKVLLKITKIIRNNTSVSFLQFNAFFNLDEL
jgi:hypothetical protein